MRRTLGTILLLGALSAPLPAQILTENAGVTPPTVPTLREFLTYFESEDVQDLRFVNQFFWGVTPQLELRLTVPTVFSRSVSFEGPDGGTESETLHGPGDASARVKYSLFQEDGVLESTRVAALAAVRIPTGEDDEADGDVPIPRRLQLGTGDFEFSGGAAFTVIRDRHRASVDAFYRHRTRHEGLRLAPSIDLDLAYWYRITPAVFDPGEDSIEVRGVLEVLSSYRFESRGRLGRDFDDEGFLIRAAPGVQVYPTRWLLFEASVQVPVYQDLDDAQGDREWGALLAFKILF